MDIHYTTLHGLTLHYTTLHYMDIHYATLHYQDLNYTTLHYLDFNKKSKCHELSKNKLTFNTKVCILLQLYSSYFSI